MGGARCVGVVGERPRQRGRDGVGPRASRYMKATYTMGAMRRSRRRRPRATLPLRVSFPAAAAGRSYLVAKVVLRVDRGEATDGRDVSPGGVVGQLPSGIHLVHEPLPRPVHTHLDERCRKRAGGMYRCGPPKNGFRNFGVQEEEDCGRCARRAAPSMASFGLSPLTPLARLLADPTHHPSGSACAGYVKGKGCPSPPVPGSASSASTTSAIANTTVSCLVAALVLGAVIFDALRGRDTWSTKFRLRRTANWFPVALCYGGFYLYVHELTHIRPLPLERVAPV